MSRHRIAPSRATVAMRGAGLALTLIAAAALAACAPRETASTAKDPAARAQELIDSGNQAYRAGNYGLAARRYAAAAVTRKDDPAAYYGMGMALSKLGRDEEARDAYAKARELAQARPDTSHGGAP